VRNILKKVFTGLVTIAVLTVCAITVGSFILSQKEASKTPDPDVPLTLDTVCDYFSQVVEVEGRLTLPERLTCSGEATQTCEMWLYDPYWSEYIDLEIPVHQGTGSPPVNSMAYLPEGFGPGDFYIMTADGRYARDGSFISVRGKTQGRGNSCRFDVIESVKVLDRLVVNVGVDLTKVTLREALTDGLVVATITGRDLSQVEIKIKPKVDLNLEVEVEPGTMFISGTEGVQNMVVRKQETIYLKPNLEVGLELEVSCANMDLKQPSSSDVFTVSAEPAVEDLARLLGLEDFPFLDLLVQQFAIWTITDNPSDSFSYTGIEINGVTEYPLVFEINQIRGLFEEAGIDTTKYLIFNN